MAELMNEYSGPLPPGWAQYADDEGRAYYFEVATGTSVWERPRPTREQQREMDIADRLQWSDNTRNQVMSQANSIKRRFDAKGNTQ